MKEKINQKSKGTHKQQTTQEMSQSKTVQNMLCIINNNIMTMCFKHLFSPPPQKTSSPSLPQTSREGLVGLLSFSSSCSSSSCLGRRRREDER